MSRRFAAGFVVLACAAVAGGCKPKTKASATSATAGADVSNVLSQDKALRDEEQELLSKRDALQKERQTLVENREKIAAQRKALDEAKKPDPTQAAELE